MTVKKRVVITNLVIVVVFIFQFVDVFFFRSSLPLFSTNIFARLLGIAILVVFSGTLGFSLKKFCFKSYGWFFEVLYGLFFSIVPLIFVYFSKYIYFLYRGYENLTLTFRPSGFGNYDGSDKYVVNVIVYILTLLLIVVFKEIFYRGYLITQFSAKYGVPFSIVLQSIIYMLSFAPTIIFYWVTGRFEFQGSLMSFFLICGHLFYNLISGLKWGMFYRVNGTVWMSVADHFFMNFVVSSFFFTENRLPEKWYIIEVIVIQLLSFIMFIPFFLKRDRQNELAAAEFALSQEALKMGFDNYSPSVLRKHIDKRIQEKNEAEIDFDYNKRQFEEPISLGDTKMPDENDLVSSVRGFAINDSVFEYKTEVASHDGMPSEKAKEYFDKMLGKEERVESDVDTENTQINENAQNISKLVKGYFEENFDKHTFN